MDSNGQFWVRKNFIARGGFGAVYIAERREESTLDLPQKMAIKSTELTRASSLINEARILERMCSPFVVSFNGDEITEEKNGEKLYNLILEYCSGLSLYNYMNKNAGRLSEKEVQIYGRDILNGLNYIHCQRIIHCDLKLDNVLLTSEDKWMRSNFFVAKIADFGLAIEKDCVDLNDGVLIRGTPCYMAPENARNEVLDYCVDVWSYGCLVLEMLTGTPVWGNYTYMDHQQIIDFIGYSNRIPTIPDFISKEAADFLKNCLNRNHEKRWTIENLLQHPFLNMNT